MKTMQETINYLFDGIPFNVNLDLGLKRETNFQFQDVFKPVDNIELAQSNITKYMTDVIYGIFHFNPEKVKINLDIFPAGHPKIYPLTSQEKDNKFIINAVSLIPGGFASNNYRFYAKDLYTGPFYIDTAILLDNVAAGLIKIFIKLQNENINPFDQYVKAYYLICEVHKFAQQEYAPKPSPSLIASLIADKLRQRSTDDLELSKLLLDIVDYPTLYANIFMEKLKDKIQEKLDECENDPNMKIEYIKSFMKDAME